ncbi:MAG: hypothetical protein GX970_10340 [Phyllobacteriaceae bacterium]|nr:hypothetical protein [Phyllobacteriaceae bacterium]
MRHLLGLSAILLTCGASSAAPWVSATISPEDPLVIAYQTDAKSGLNLTFECYPALALLTIYVISDANWDEGASYADVVLPVFIIDGVQYGTHEFDFMNWEGYESISSECQAGYEGFMELYQAIYQARGEINVSYFDKSATFSAEGAKAAIDTVENACW